VKETTAEIWIGPSQNSDWAGTKGGINATHLLLLRENSRPAWMLLPGNLYDSNPPELTRPKVWVPSFKHPLEDALLLFAVMGAKIPEVKAVFSEFVKSVSRARFDVDSRFPSGFPKQVYLANRRHLKDWSVVVSVGNSSHANADLDVLEKYKAIDFEIRTTSQSQLRLI
jgi:hypothetical protein